MYAIGGTRRLAVDSDERPDSRRSADAQAWTGLRTQTSLLLQVNGLVGRI